MEPVSQAPGETHVTGVLRNIGAAVAAAFLTCAASVALADVTVQQHISVEGTGLMSAGNMSGTTKTIISGDRSRTDSDIQLQSRVVRMLAHRAVGPTAEIVRLDQDRIDRLDISRKQYTEITFEEMKARLQKVMDRAQESQGQPQESQKPMDDSKCEWLDPKVDVRQPGEKATYAGYEAERLIIVASQPCKDKESGAICEVALALDEWLAPNFAASGEEDRFHRAYAQKIGLGSRGELGRSDITQRAQSMFGRYSGIWSEIVAKTRDVKGYPVKMTFAFAFGGEQCKGSRQPQQQDADNSAAPPASGGLTGQVAGKLSSLLHRKKDDAAAGTSGQTAAQLLPGGLSPLITMSSELVSVSTDNVGADVFEIPADFKKIEHQAD